MTQRTRHRGPFNMPMRYAFCAAFGLAMFALLAAMTSHRAELEPVVRLLHPFLLGRHSLQGYQAGDYVFYEVLVGIFGVLPFPIVAYGFVTKGRTDRKIDQYLADRLPRHEVASSKDES